MTRLLYASDAEDNHEEPWLDGWDPALCDAATGAREYAEEHGLDAGDHVYVIEASAYGEPDSEGHHELAVHRTWRFVVTVATDDATEIEEVAS